MMVAHPYEVGVTLAPFISAYRIYVWYKTDLGKICKILKCCVVNFLKKNGIRNWNEIRTCNHRLSSYVTLPTIMFVQSL